MGISYQPTMGLGFRFRGYIIYIPSLKLTNSHLKKSMVGRCIGSFLGAWEGLYWGLPKSSPHSGNAKIIDPRYTVCKLKAKVLDDFGPFDHLFPVGQTIEIQ